MKAVCFAAVLAAVAMIGCGPGIDPANSGPRVCAFSAASIRIIGLTRIVARPAERNEAALAAYVDMLDAYDSHIKAPGLFRFELYEFVPRSSEPRGKRLMIWPDIDLTDPDANNDCWQDYLRTYQFTLDMNFRPGPDNTFILETTCITPTGKRLADTRQIYYDQ